MGRSDASSRWRRLAELEGLIRSRGSATSASLAEDLGVSLRTLNRDLATLRENGVPIEADRGRGGGVRLHRDWTLCNLRLAPEEAIDLLLSVAIAERMESPVFLRRLAGVRRKLAAAFAADQHGRIRSLRRRILVGAPASPAVLASLAPSHRPALAAIADPFFHQQCIEIDYVDAAGTPTTRAVEPQFLYLTLPVWYVLGWDRLRGAIRIFRMDRIRALRPLSASFRLAEAGPYLAQAEADVETL